MLTKDEAELYDRQIRLWGVNAQSRLRQSKVLMLGFNGVASEVAKILVLAGIDTLTIVDDQPLDDNDITSNLFCRTKPSSDGGVNEFRTHQVREKLRTLNPLVKVHIDNTSILDKKPEDFKGFDLVTLQSFLTIDQTNYINDICRKEGIKFYLVLDYGFFGFMFNDLGDEFKYTYEEYDDKKKEISKAIQNIPTKKQSGGIKDPISVDDEHTDTTQESAEDGDHEVEEGRPKKRMRLEEPTESKKTPEEKNEMKHCAGTANYVNLQDVISFKGTKFDRKTSPILFLSIAMMNFYTEHKHLPLPSSEQNDISELNKIIASMRDRLNLNEFIFKKLSPEWSKHITGSLSPVCAIVGGVAGQDMIRALSGKDIPICNTFSFDGIEMSGVIEKVGIEEKKIIVKEPVVRDFLQIEDSN